MKLPATLTSFYTNGYALVQRVLTDAQIDDLLKAIEAVRTPDDPSAGTRHLLTRSAFIREFARSGPLLQLATGTLSNPARPVKAIVFDKTSETNWYVTWHQDLTIAVKQRPQKDANPDGFGPWSVKDGLPHVQPPAAILEQMVSLRIHLDDCPEDNGAIKFIPGSHAQGVMDNAQLAAWKTRPSVTCDAARGDIIMMRPLILHSSSQSANPAHRRVLHIEYAATDLPHGLEWAEASGLDTVELVMAFEEEFGIEIPDADAEVITTAGEVYEYFKNRLATSDPKECLTQKIFYELRRSLIRNFNLNRRDITPDTRMVDLLTLEQIESGWPYLQMFTDFKTPDFKRANEILGFKLADRMLTMREMVYELIGLNADKLILTRPEDADIWQRVVDVTVRQLNVDPSEVQYQTSFTRDLGAC